jgi:hypothetical protein
MPIPFRVSPPTPPRGMPKLPAAQSGAAGSALRKATSIGPLSPMQRLMRVAEKTLEGLGLPIDSGMNDAERAASEMMVPPVGIIPYAAAKLLPGEIRNLAKNELAALATRNTAGAQITDEGLRLLVRRQQQPSLAGEVSLRKGTYHLANPKSPNVHFYKRRNAGHGGSMALEGETLVKNPLVVSAKEGGYMAEKAIEQLTSKNNELSKIYHWQPGSTHEMRVMLDKALEGNVPLELEDAYRDMRRSRNWRFLASNRLRELYAGELARKQGFDAILGISTGTYGHPRKFNEFFDLRETRYPTETQHFIDPDYQPTSLDRLQRISGQMRLPFGR